MNSSSSAKSASIEMLWMSFNGTQGTGDEMASRGAVTIRRSEI